MKIDYKITKEQHLYTRDQKIKWCGYGEWAEEPDCIMIEYLGYEAMIQRVLKREPFCPEETYFGGHLCGYLKIPKDHPLFKTSLDLDCHGGITYYEWTEEHWVGFDCGHLGDYIPTMESLKNQRKAAGEFEIFPIPEEFKQYAIFNPSYKNITYCIDELIGMIDELIGMIDQLVDIKEKIREENH
jgi:hypothetical protein